MKPRSSEWAGTRVLAVLLMVVISVRSGDALAYVGPGAGLGVIGAIIGSILGLLALVVGAVWYPLKKLIAKFRRPR